MLGFLFGVSCSLFYSFRWWNISFGFSFRFNVTSQKVKFWEISWLCSFIKENMKKVLMLEMELETTWVGGQWKDLDYKLTKIWISFEKGNSTLIIILYLVKINTGQVRLNRINRFERLIYRREDNYTCRHVDNVIMVQIY